MIPLRLRDVAAATGGRIVGHADTEVVALTTDSRDVPEGALFVALRGETHDGHDHVAGAHRAGAIAVLVEERWAHPRPEVEVPAVVVADTWSAIADLARDVRERVDPTVIALTGSVGKTTTKDLAAAACRAGRRTVAARGSFNNEVGVPLTCLSVESDTEVLVCEVGSRGVGHIASLMPVVQPDIAVVTAVGAAHLEMFGDVDTVARAKRELVEALPPDGTAVLNAEDPRVAAMAAATDASVVRFGRADRVEDADVVAEDVTLDRLARARFRARTPWGGADVRLPLAGVHHVGNALAALAAAAAAGVDLAAAAAALADAPISSWRSDVREVGGVTVLNDAYNANPASVRAALDTLVAIEATGRTWAVLGLMAELGDTSEADHREVGGYVVERGVDRLVVVGDAAPIDAGAAAGGMPDDRRWQVADADAALALLRGRVEPGDAVLVKASRVGGLEQVAAGLVEDGGAGGGA